MATTSFTPTYPLLWLDANAEENLITQSELNAIANNTLLVFVDAADCQKFIQDTVDAIVLIVSGSLGKDFVPLVHECPQVVGIYIFCADKKLHLTWSTTYRKIKTLVTDSDSLVVQIGKDYRQRQPLTFNICKQDEGKSHKNLLDDNIPFIWLELFLETILRLAPDDIANSRRELVAYLRSIYSGSQVQMNRIDEFERTCTVDNSIQLYSNDGCIFQALNKALRVGDWNALIKYRCFIHNLYKQLRNEQKACKDPPLASTVHVYRGQLISAVEITQLKNAVGQYISLNSFLSTSEVKELILPYASEREPCDVTQSILFDIEIDTSKPPLKPFARISHLSVFGDGEREVLFMLGTVFRVSTLEQSENKKLWILKLQLCHENPHRLQELYRYRKQELRSETNSTDLESLVEEMSVFADETKSILLYDQIDRCKLGTWQVADSESEGNSLVHGLARLACTVYPSETTYNRLGAECCKKGDYDAAQKNFEQVLSIQRKCYQNEQSFHVARTYHQLGRVHEMKGDYHQAMDYYKTSVEIHGRQCHSKEQSLALADVHKSMATVHHHLKEYDLALSSAGQALSIYSANAPENSPESAKLYHRQGIIDEECRRYGNALECFTKAFGIYKEVYPFKYGQDNDRHRNLLMMDITRRLLRVLSVVKDKDNMGNLEKYYREFNKHRLEAYWRFKGEVLSWQIDDVTR